MTQRLHCTALFGDALQRWIHIDRSCSDVCFSMLERCRQRTLSIKCRVTCTLLPALVATYLAAIYQSCVANTLTARICCPQDVLKSLRIALGSSDTRFSAALGKDKRISVTGTVKGASPYLTRIGTFDVDLSLDGIILLVRNWLHLHRLLFK